MNWTHFISTARSPGRIGGLLLTLACGAGFGDCGRSVPLECVSNRDCPEELRCSAQRSCVAPQAECATDRECGHHYRCEHFDCVPLDACRDDFDCQAPKRCDKERPQDLHGRCRTPQQCPQACAPHHFCGVDLRCIPDGACGSDGDCEEHQQCERGRCLDARCASNQECDAPRHCDRDGLCRLPRTCRFDQDCPGPGLCQDKRCVDRPECEDCPAPHQCIQNRCVPALRWHSAGEDRDPPW